ncbi:hypothetical protein HYH03_011981 [Edaphochlamys debaryana]|uniref:Uncharacterized protein n=1 Tax=Edaphochlamys debaryana TaxID=47281 RepID=A0A835XZ31_9CHLO|nr:hypothetical protein HYH03_011981 [Edaphochlamys debaryana]|eukprot:KAG2489530.1 hypothetical protein HYH03_011981 [Edaphochlamys debaryana]
MRAQTRAVALGVVVLALAATAAAVDVTAELPAHVDASAITCVKQKDALQCDLLSDCVWCAKPGTKWGTGCYPMSAARLLPKKWGVECDKDLTPSPEPQPQREQEQAEQVQASACDGKSEGSCVAPACVWCTSAAVGGGCYTPEEAKKLPGAIFKCKTTPSAGAWGDLGGRAFRGAARQHEREQQ